MDFDAFEARAHALFDSIPDELRGGVEYLAVERRTVRHPGMAGVLTLGECATGELELGDALSAEVRSGIHLYWGSFRALSRDDPEFDWEAELWETLTHELRHHRESGAGEDALEDFDYAADENFKRREGAPFDPLFYRMGELAPDGWFDVDGDRFLERPAPPEGAEERIQVPLDGRIALVDAPAERCDVHYLYLDEGEARDTDTALVLVRRRSAWETLTGLLRRRPPEVMESAAEWRFAP